MIEYHWETETVQITGSYLHANANSALASLFTSEGLVPIRSKNGLAIDDEQQVHGTGNSDIDFMSPVAGQRVWNQYNKYKNQYSGFEASLTLVKLLNTSTGNEQYFVPSQTGQKHTSFKNGQLVMTPDKTVYFKKTIPK